MLLCLCPTAMYLIISEQTHIVRGSGLEMEELALWGKCNCELFGRTDLLGSPLSVVLCEPIAPSQGGLHD